MLIINSLAERSRCLSRPRAFPQPSRCGNYIDEEALIATPAAGKLRGAALDVYAGEFEHEPDRRLWDDERVLITPHISGGSDMRRHRGINLFCDNLRAYLDGRPLTNVVDWADGY